MPRAVLLAFLALPALLAGCGTSASTPVSVPRPAGEQRANLQWVESTGTPQSRLVFRVRNFSVVEGGWTADVSVTNDTAVTFGIDGFENPFGNAFGLMLFRTGSHAELEQRNGIDLPTPRPAMSVAPALPASLVPRSTWSGTVSARGALPSGLWVRLVFGAFVSEGHVAGEPPSVGRTGRSGLDHRSHLQAEMSVQPATAARKAPSPASTARSASAAAAARSAGSSSSARRTCASASAVLPSRHSKQARS